MVVSCVARFVSVGKFGPSIVVVHKHRIVVGAFCVAFDDTVATDAGFNPGHRSLLHRSLDVFGVGQCVDRVVV